MTDSGIDLPLTFCHYNYIQPIEVVLQKIPEESHLAVMSSQKYSYNHRSKWLTMNQIKRIIKTIVGMPIFEACDDRKIRI
ncbi:MAG: hypothetical protein A2X22_04000 [Bacteroidetes bacterium GWF2_49_14]|nr:MAG: hypothetical protein A2X22_04000 [Bacteroidetes bacterium GWF2_49_14]HBB91680.1 hypothetical protein [Bacteroidales bacterium]